MKIVSYIKKSGFSIIITILFLVALVLLNIFIGLLTERFFLKADLTDTGLYTLSERAAEFLGDVDEPVDIIVLAEESVWRASSTYEIITNILRNYSASSNGNLRVQYVNPDLNSFAGQKYNNSLAELKDAYTELEDMSRNDIIFLSERRAAVVPATTLFAQSTDQFRRPVITGIRVDTEFISALIYVLNEKIARITYITNHAEDTTYHMNLAFERSGYVSSVINLALEDIPEDTVVLVSAAPKYDFLNEEIIKIEEFLALGGNAIILYDSQLLRLPLLDMFLMEWGVIIEEKVIFDDVYIFIPELGVLGAHVVAGSLPFTADAELITTSMIPLGVIRARPLNSDVGSRFTINPLISTFSASSYAKDISGGNITTQERESGDESGPFVIGYNVSRITNNAEGKQVQANLIVAGATLFDDSFLNMFGDSFYNSIMLIDLANDFNPFGERVYIPSKDLSDSTMLVSSGGTRMIFIFLVIAMPLTILAAGTVVWYKRRHK